MIPAWRLCSSRHDPLSGEGARLVGGRWNSPGTRLVYASSSLALCLAECLVHVSGSLPRDYVSVRLALPEEGVEVLDESKLRRGWQKRIAETRRIGDGWLERNESLALQVPSAVLPDSANLLINPNNAAFDRIEIEEARPFRFDPRLRR